MFEQQNDESYLRLRKTALVADRKVGDGFRLEAETPVIRPGTLGPLIHSRWGRWACERRVLMRKGRVLGAQAGRPPSCRVRKQSLRLRLEEHIRSWRDDMGRGGQMVFQESAHVQRQEGQTENPGFPGTGSH